MLFKNVASQGVYLFLIDSSTGAGKTGDASNISATVSIDGGASSASANSVSEIGGGVYTLTLSQAETNGDRLAIIPSSSTSSVVGSPIIAFTTGGAVPAAAAGAAAGLALPSSVDDVETKIDTLDTVADGLATTLGTAGAGLTDLGGFSTAAKAEINAEADTALADYDAPTKTELDAAFTEIKGASWASGTDTLEALRDRGDAAWVTATGFSTHSAADVWAVGTRTLSAFSFAVDVGTIESTDASDALETAATASLNSYDAPTKAEMDSKFTTTDGLIGTVDTVVDGLATTLGTAGAGLTDLGGMSTTMKGQVNTEADNALADYDAPTKSELDSAFTEIKGATWSSGTDSLEAIRDRGDAAWVTATGFNTVTPPTASAISDAVWDELQSGHTTAGTFGYYLDAQVSSAASPPTAAAIADAVWDELSSGHSVSGSYGKAIADGVTGWATATGFSTFDPAADTVANVTTVAALAEAAVTDIWSTYSIPESYASQGSAATAAQMLYAAQAMDQEKSISSTTVTCKKLDQSTTAATFTLDSSSSPTSITRAT